MKYIIIDTAHQILSLYDTPSDLIMSDLAISDNLDDSYCIARYSVSTAKNGTGQLAGSYCTPLGKHRIAQKIGENAPINAVFVGRVFTGEIYNETLAAAYPKRDWILTRILWLDGLEDGFNRGTINGTVCDSHARYIYIHGTPDSEPMGVPRSHGCIRMRNDEMVAVFDWVDAWTLVMIV